jgi:tripartite-type tricarboxylate transporter receptor subunit TctC
MTFPLSRRRVVQCLLAASLPGSLSVALAQAYPSRPLKLIVPFPPGGSTDVIARMIAQRMSDALKTPVVVENKPGVGSLLGTDVVAKAAADGYTLIVSANPAIAPGRS